jgi:hypothetical protein
MSSVKDIIDSLKGRPTILYGDVEADFARRLMEASDDDLTRHRAEVRFILNKLYISHVENEFLLADVESDYVAFFRRFWEWLNDQNTKLSLGIDGYVIEEFGRKREDILQYFSEPPG